MLVRRGHIPMPSTLLELAQLMTIMVAMLLELLVVTLKGGHKKQTYITLIHM
jgi:hypothetical protein